MTPDEAYRETRERLDVAMVRLSTNLTIHRNRQASGVGRWASVADLNHVTYGLAELADFLESGAPKPEKVGS